MPGPTPQAHRRRSNPPTIPTTVLPAGGFRGPVPAVPAWVTLRAAGASWWRWVWRTPQAAGWAGGHEGVVARRACLEDDLADARETGPVRSAVLREMRELDDRLGLTPKGMAALRWRVEAEEALEQRGQVVEGRWAELRVVDGSS